MTVSGDATSAAKLPIVFVHGLIGSLDDVRALAHLRPRAVASPDFHGYGADADAVPSSITIASQADVLRSAVEQIAPRTAVHLVGHSVGCVIAAEFALRHPDRVGSFINVEGNFTLDDAFWSAQLAEMPPEGAAALLDAYRSDPAGWLQESGVEPTPERTRAAEEALAFQPASTLQAMARAVVTFTGHPEYERLLRDVFARVPVHLVAGSRSRAGWNVPDWALDAAASYNVLPDTGHMVMLEAPDAFGRLLAQLC